MLDNFEEARLNMVEQQIKPWNMHDSRVLEALRQVRREDFVPDEYQSVAFADIAIPLSDGNSMLEPKIVAHMLQSLSLSESDRALVIGVGTGYVAALFAKLVNGVVCVDPRAQVLDAAKRNIAMSGISNVEFHQRDVNTAWPAGGEVDVVFFRNSMKALPDPIGKHLAPGGRCVAVIGQGSMMELTLFSKQEQQLVSQSILDTATPGKASEEASKPKFIF